MDKVSFKSSDGVKLVGVWNKPENPTQKAIILAHGIGNVDKDEYGIFTELAELLKENGYAVFRFDFRGHGESSGRSVDFTIAGELLDLGAAIDLVRKKYKNIGLLGTSFGGNIVALYVAKNKNIVKALCLWNPVLNYDHVFLNPYLPWLGDKKEQMQKDLRDKGWTEIGSKKFKMGKKLFEEMKGIFPYQALHKIGIPTIIIHGDNDQHVPYEDSKTYVSNLKQGKLTTISGGEHGFQENKEHRIKVLEETLNFFRENL